MAKAAETETVVEKQKTCGIIMPISNHPDYPLGHWKDVLNILFEAIGTTGFKPNLVSRDDAIGLIHERIVTNIYSNEMVVCDVSSKNPNVMFELGLRLAFDKPVVIITDNEKNYTFDIGGIEHLPYPSSLRFADVVSFKENLAARINATYERSIKAGYSPFLQSFGKTIVPSKIGEQQITETQFLMQQLEGMKDEMKRMRYSLKNQDFPSVLDKSSDYYSPGNVIRGGFGKKGRDSKELEDLNRMIIDELKKGYSSDDVLKNIMPWFSIGDDESNRWSTSVARMLIDEIKQNLDLNKK